MEKKQIKYFITNIFCVLLVIVAKLIQTNIFMSESIINRKINLYIGLFVTIPAFIIATVTFYILVKYFFKNKISTVYLSLLVPYILLILTTIYFLINIALM